MNFYSIYCGISNIYVLNWDNNRNLHILLPIFYRYTTYVEANAVELFTINLINPPKLSF